MNRRDLVPRRRARGVSAAVLLFVSGCGKKKDADRGAKLSAPVPAADSALVDTLAGQASGLSAAPPSEDAPAWTQERPHFFDRDGRRFAAAVGWARTRDAALARAAAEDRARAELMILLRGGAGGGEVEGALPGARMTDSYASKDGSVFVRVEVAAPKE